MPIPTFPFVWERHFVGEQDTYDCVPACVAMCARYWNEQTKLDLPIDTDEWRETFERFKIHSPRGINLGLLRSSFKKLTPKNGVGLRLRTEFVNHVNDVTKLFEQEPAFPCILCYDRRMTLHNAIGPQHASLLHSVDTIKERVRVIDPSLIHRDTPSTYDMIDFIRGWEETGKLVIIPYPSNIKLQMNTKKNKKIKPLESYNGDKK